MDFRAGRGDVGCVAKVREPHVLDVQIVERLVYRSVELMTLLVDKNIAQLGKWSAQTVVYATMGYVTSDRIRQILPMRPENCFARPELDRMSPGYEGSVRLRRKHVLKADLL